MKTASVRDLRYDFPKIESLLKQGEEIRITKRRKVIARLVPEKPDFRPQCRIGWRAYALFAETE